MQFKTLKPMTEIVNDTEHINFWYHKLFEIIYYKVCASFLQWPILTIQFYSNYSIQVYSILTIQF
jgi:hypothetical protein